MCFYHNKLEIILIFAVLELWNSALFSPLGKLVGRAICFSCANFFPFNDHFEPNISRDLPDRFLLSFHRVKAFRVQINYLNCFFSISQGTLPWQPSLCRRLCWLYVSVLAHYKLFISYRLMAFWMIITSRCDSDYLRYVSST